MEPKNRKYIIGIGILLLVLVALVLFIVFRSAKNGGGDDGGGIFGGILPDTGGGGGGGGDGTGTIGGGTPQPSPGDILPIPEEERVLLVQLTKDPIVGAAIKYGEEKVLYFKRGIGNIFEVPFDGSAAEERIFHFTIPSIIGVEWSPKRTYALVSVLAQDEQKHLWLNVTSTSTLDSGFLQVDAGSEISGIAFSPVEDKIALVTQNETGSSVFISDPKGVARKKLASLPVSGLIPKWISKNMISLQTKPSAFSTSLLATLNAQSGASDILLSDVEGLDVMWDTKGSEFLALETRNNGRGFALSLRSRAKPDDAHVEPYITLPEKCVFSKTATSSAYCAFPREWPREALPDGWWQGKVSFSDELWLVNLATEAGQQILSGGGFDMTNLFLSEDERFIFFTNKKDSALWSFRLKE